MRRKSWMGAGWDCTRRDTTPLTMRTRYATAIIRSKIQPADTSLLFTGICCKVTRVTNDVVYYSILWVDLKATATSRGSNGVRRKNPGRSGGERMVVGGGGAQTFKSWLIERWAKGARGRRVKPVWEMRLAECRRHGRVRKKKNEETVDCRGCVLWCEPQRIGEATYPPSLSPTLVKRKYVSTCTNCSIVRIT